MHDLGNSISLQFKVQRHGSAEPRKLNKIETMEYLKIIAVVFLMIFVSCGSKNIVVKDSKESEKTVLGKSRTLSYESLGNGVATISLQLYENDTFKFDFESIPQPGTDEKALVISEKGKYTSEGAWKTLHFKNPKFSLASIFDANYGAGNEFKMVDKNSVKINTEKSSITIWGVVCEKQ